NPAGCRCAFRRRTSGAPVGTPVLLCREPFPVRLALPARISADQTGRTGLNARPPWFGPAKVVKTRSRRRQFASILFSCKSGRLVRDLRWRKTELNVEHPCREKAGRTTRRGCLRPGGPSLVATFLVLLLAFLEIPVPVFGQSAGADGTSTLRDGSSQSFRPNADVS